MTQPGLFSHAEASSISDILGTMTNLTPKLADRRAEVRRSALWAAYGDALGWISELTDEAGLDRRTAGASLCRPVEWKRKIGGYGGVTVRLPQGCYSDDSQLRLATCRAIRPGGFDVEAFAKVELPVWLSYALGGGKSTSAAATNLVKPKVAWFANTFKGWTRSGGNGAAMRIQPHVWAAPTPRDAESFIFDVVRNAVCSHSHPSGLMGAVLHALALAHVMATGRHPSPEEFFAAVEVVANLPRMLRDDIEVGSYWRAAFEREAGAFAEAWARMVEECREAIRTAAEDGAGADGEGRYAGIVDRLRLRDPARRGSGMLTAVAATALTWCETRPEEALRIAANAIGTDTDTIATMSGAILGIVATVEPPVEVLDAALFRSEADRLAEIAAGGRPRSHQYPDLLHWTAPKTRADTVTLSQEGDIQVRGLGYVVRERSEPIASPKGDFCWQWLELETGQTLLIKRRRILAREEQPRGSWPVPPTGDTVGEHAADTRRVEDSHAAIQREVPEDTAKWRESSLDLQRALDYLDKHKDDDGKVGSALRQVVKRGTKGQIAAFTAALIDYLR